MSKVSSLIVFSAAVIFITVNSIQINKLSLPRTLGIAQKTANATINGIIVTFNESYTSAKKKMNEVGEQIINKSIDIGQQIHGKLSDLLKRKENEMKELMNNANGIDIEECTKISKNLEVIALAAMSNVSSCIVDKIELGGSYIESISKISNDVMSNLTSISKDIYHCSKSVTDSINCAKNAASNAVWIGTHTIPNVISHIGKLSILMGGLPVSVPSCAVSHGYNTFTQQYEDISRRIKNCVDQKIVENNGSTEKYDQNSDNNN